MRRAEYLADPDVRGFAGWLGVRFVTPDSFDHSWRSRKPQTSWSCTSLLDAHENYEWKGRSYVEDESILDCLSFDLRSAVAAGDQPRVESLATEVLRWGGIARTGAATLANFHSRLGASRSALDPALADTDRLSAVPMNAGFSKVYHLLLDGFPMYDTRVGAALGLLARRFLESEGRDTVPLSLGFGWGPGRIRSDGSRPQRDPSRGSLQFSSFANRPVFHATSNVMAAWLFGELARLDCFAPIEPSKRVRAVESAFFMIGYDIGQPG